MISYILQVLLFQSLFLAVYDFFLQKETFFKWNRIYLLATPLLSFLIPFLKIESMQQTISQEYAIQLPTVFLNPQSAIESSTTSELIFAYLSNAYIVGGIIFTLLFMVRLYQIIALINKNTIVKKANYKLVLIAKKQVAFSFFNFIFISKLLQDKKELAIIQHEIIHCKQKHSIDLLVFEILKIAMWFNPLIYVYQKRITLLHEYIADAEVVKVTNKNSYFNNLLSETFNVEHISFINQFYKQSFIKKRIAMITKNKSEKMKQFKYLLIIPLVFTMLILSSFEEQEDQKSISTKSDVESSTIKPLDSIIPAQYVAFANIDEVPVFPSCENSEDQRKCLQDNITQHVNKNFNTKLADSLNLKPGLKRIFVMFLIDKNGEISEVKARAPHKALEQEAIRVINSLPKMTPGKQNGKAVGVKYSLPIAFKVGGVEMVDSDSVSSRKENPIIIVNEKEITREEMQKIKPDDIQSINVLKGEKAIEKYGEKGKNGIIEITLKE